jgi:prolyl 4-hydroxylase
MSILKEHNFPLESFIAGWYIDEKICNDLIDLFKENKEHHKQGVIGGPYNINREQKDSIDLGIHPNYEEKRFVAYKESLKQCVNLYEKKYPELKQFEKYGLVEGGNIQYYPPGGGYFAEHSERNCSRENRCLVWMTYLNDVPEAGTNFKYQNITTPAKKGLTLIWPTDFTHTHKGQISQTHEKYIITGWFGFIR